MKKILVMFTMMMVAMVTFAKDIKTVVFTTTPQMHCAACENKIKSNLRFEKGIKSIETSVPNQTVTVQYNADKTTPEKLNAKEREIILVDDGSDICAINGLTEYLQDIIYLRQPNQGASVARNYGMMIAKGRFIQFVDGDDYLVQTAYEHCLDIVRYHQPDIVTFNYVKRMKIESRPIDYVKFHQCSV